MNAKTVIGSVLLTVVLAVLCLLGTQAAKAQTAVVLGDGFAVAEQRTVSVALPCNPTTGYVWYADIDTAAVICTTERFAAPANVGVTGQDGWQLFQFKCLDPAHTTIVFYYARAWEQRSYVDRCQLMLDTSLSGRVTAVAAA